MALYNGQVPDAIAEGPGPRVTRVIGNQIGFATATVIGASRTKLPGASRNPPRLAAHNQSDIAETGIGAVRFLHLRCGKDLTTFLSGLKYRSIRISPKASGDALMNFIQPANNTYTYPQSEAMENKCLHSRVQVVSRDEDAEFVECLECREIFESSEFRDMDIEAKIPSEEE